MSAILVLPINVNTLFKVSDGYHKYSHSELLQQYVPLYHDMCAGGRLAIRNINGHHLFMGGVPSKSCMDLW